MWSHATAHRILKDRLQAGAGDTVFVVGGSGGMGSATLDPARLMGVRVVAVTRSEAKVDFLQACGAHHVVVLPAPDACTGIRAAAGLLDVDGAVVLKS